ncbi:MAG: GNAT family N-acetyltransferase [Clostridia bacterium]|nr:GNAT family N-acetyltransferase [Clostridia bacterium]
MRFHRVTSPVDPRFTEAMALYGQSFPAHEQREAASQAAIMSCKDYHFTAIESEDGFIGAILYWEAPRFLYVEHFCIETRLRGHGYGQAALKLLGEQGKTVILEIDPPVDDVARRRQRFYERAGYCANPFPHVHPPYHAGNHGHDLVIMSSPAPLSQAVYDEFNRFLRERVMGQ